MSNPENNEELLTKLKSIGDALVARENDLWAFFSISDDLFCVAEKDGRLLRVNPAWTRCLGWGQDEIVGHEWLDFIHPDDIECTAAEAEAMLERNAMGFENRYRHKDGSYRNLLWTGKQWGKEGLTYAVARDVTKKREAESLLKELGRDRAALNGKTDKIIELLRA
jgi:PAS domain S-box-containing protein